MLCAFELSPPADGCSAGGGDDCFFRFRFTLVLDLRAAEPADVDAAAALLLAAVRSGARLCARSRF